ncbi:D-alanine--D-alanine ligase [Francisella philomiragia]|uniref:D-alanine--D-alanine ligase n=1 Tax=Francisella philomiragia subsp. philomiragia (strain ATCC 25017 / CCUG 19701 / FSC 153 / O\|nr:D-alanine--D-alanine ligase [Francisella philomiragia]B0TVX5.1 RecName: Full=D-alanine--D-alanine ligase; AltName: Full=D-Ala-D-Ala ligase; AltName: Full=D-alanylalanine synthetase [Francisella philomiragia subsp. philomiragia ATCC 25017]AJI47290.1 D-alanine--D-alanine ligase family protein [Francisella philomiragia]AJI50089.1 D-alanine--D-alanine ligase family protein [Francisella philomiragia]MBK2021489.1 D-alanine--D-alanine ligase [Francisella philomiragia]MBK2031417.1 D-alanine--D-alan
MQKEKIVVLYGGDSPEREVSLKSGKAVLDSLLNQGYDAVGLDASSKDLVVKLLELNPDKCFIALHGEDGENGRVAALLELLGIKHTGSTMKSCVVTMDKMISKEILMHHRMPTPMAKFLTDRLVEADEISFPVAVKPSSGGSSIATFKVKSLEELENAYQQASKHGEVMIEQWVTGKEITVAIVNNDVYSSVWIEPLNEFYDYESKYSGKSIYHAPSGLCEQKELEVRQLAKKAYDLLGCKGHARVDFIYDDKGDFYIMEINSSPGMTENSLSPKSAAAEGIDFDSFVKSILEQAQC